MSDIITKDEATPERLRALFEQAFIDCNVDDQGDLAIQGTYKYFLRIIPNKFVRYYCAIRVPDNASKEAVSRYCERVNREMIVLRLAPFEDNGAIVFDWYISVEGGITPKAVVSSFRIYEDLLKDALSRDQDGVLR